MNSNYSKFLSDVTLLKKASEMRKLVIFAGAGVSINSGLPSWGKLVGKLKDDIGITKEDTEDPLQIAQVYFNERKHKEYIEKIRELLYYKKKKYNQLHEIIFDLKPEHIITTNYDDYFEQVIKSRALSFSIIKQDKEFPYASNTNLLVKIHGDLDNDDFILKEDDYLNYEYNHPLFESFIKSTFASKVVLFVGYSYSDVNLKSILQKVRNILGHNFQTSYFLSDEKMSEYKTNYLKDKGVNVVNFSENESYITNYLNGKNSVGKQYLNNKINLPTRGEKLYKLLSFINFFDRYKEDLSKKSVLEQMSQSLSRYEELNALPYYFIANIYPFNDTAKRVYHDESQPFVLAITNLNIIKFLHDNTTVNNNVTEFTEDYKKSLDTKQLTISQTQLSHIINVLEYAGMYFVDTPYSKTSTFNKTKDVVMTSESAKCECLNCLFDNLKLDKLLDTIATTSITELSNLKEDLQLAYIHYKLKNIYIAFTMFEEIARKSWQAGKYITYFISKINYKKLARLIDFAEYENIGMEEITKLKERANSIDLEDIYRQITDVSKEESALIREIRDNSVLIYCKNEIESNYSKVLEVNESLDNGVTYQFATDHSMNVRFFLLVIDLFYSRNYIVEDFLGEFISTFNTGLRALLISYKYSDKYPVEYKLLDITFCKGFIHYAKVSDFEEFFIKNKINRITISNDTKVDTVKTAVSYLNSYYKSKSSNSVESNNKVYNQSNRNLYHTFSDFFSNIFFLLSKIDLEDEDIKSLVNSTIPFLKVADFLYWRHIKYLMMFVESNKNTLDIVFIENLIQTLTSNSNQLSSDILENIGFLLKDKDSEQRVSNEKTINLLKSHINAYSINTANYSNNNILYVWMIANDELRKSLRSEIERGLVDNFDNERYRLASIFNAIEWEEFLPMYVESLNEIYIKNSAVTLKDGKLNDTSFIGFIVFFYRLHISPNDERIKVLYDAEEYVKFYLNPKHYDYSKFDPKWLALTGSFIVHSKISECTQIKEHLAAYIKNNPDSKFYADLFIKFYL